MQIQITLNTSCVALGILAKYYHSTFCHLNHYPVKLGYSDLTTQGHSICFSMDNRLSLNIIIRIDLLQTSLYLGLESVFTRLGFLKLVASAWKRIENGAWMADDPDILMGRLLIFTPNLVNLILPVKVDVVHFYFLLTQRGFWSYCAWELTDVALPQLPQKEVRRLWNRPSKGRHTWGLPVSLH